MATKREMVSVICFYWVVSISLVLLNKVMFSSGDVGLKGAPLFLTWTQIVVAVGCVVIAHNIKPITSRLDFFPYFEYDLNIALRVAPLTLIFLGMIIFNNLTLKYVEVSFYQVARALTIVFNIIATYLILGKSTSRKAIGSCVVIVAGYVLGVEGEVRFSMKGVVFGVLSSVFVCLYSIFVKKILPILDNNSWRLLIYNNMNAMFLMPPLIVMLGEVEAVTASENLYKHSFWAMLVVVGLFGFLINIASFMQIQYTSPLTHNVSGTAKACVQTLLGFAIWQNPVSPQGVFGTFLSILGCGLYGYVRFLETPKKSEHEYKPVATKQPSSVEMDRYAWVQKLWLHPPWGAVV